MLNQEGYEDDNLYRSATEKQANMHEKKQADEATRIANSKKAENAAWYVRFFLKSMKREDKTFDDTLAIVEYRHFLTT